MRGFRIVLIFLSLVCLNSCTKKELDLGIEQDECKRFKIERPSYNRLEDPCTGSSNMRAQILFSFKKSEECLHLIRNKPVFYDFLNNVINPSSFTETILKPNFTIQDNQVSYEFSATFADSLSASKLNHIVLDFNTENEVQDASNTLQIRINTSCSQVDPSTYNVNPNGVVIPRSQQLFLIQLWDNAAEDGDIVSAHLNGNWIIENHSLVKDTTDFVFPTSLLNNGSNDLVLFALNEGSSGPNTVSIAVNGITIPNFKPGLLTGEAVRIDF